MSYDVKMFVLCTHVIDGEMYEPQRCKKCYGRGFYFDIHFDAIGQPSLAVSTPKLQQELIKIIMEDKGSNKFHENWGCDVGNRMIGQKNDPHAKIRIEMLVRDAVTYLMDVQKENQLIFENMDETEIIDSIVSVDVKSEGPTGYVVHVVIRAVTGEMVPMTIEL